MSEPEVTEEDVFGCNWEEWASGIAETQFVQEAAKQGKPKLAEALAVITVMVITESQRMIAEEKLLESVQLLNCLKRLITSPGDFFSMLENVIPVPTTSTKH